MSDKEEQGCGSDQDFTDCEGIQQEMENSLHPVQQYAGKGKSLYNLQISPFTNLKSQRCGPTSLKLLFLRLQPRIGLKILKFKFLQILLLLKPPSGIQPKTATLQ